jgi:hypothetical protein
VSPARTDTRQAMRERLEVIGVRHHSPACARLLRQRLHDFRPDVLLIEGPSDFTPRIGELQDPAHQPPIALFSYFGDALGTRHTFAPFADFSPEWVALQEARALAITTRFIDLPYWHEDSRGRAATEGERQAATRQQRREQALAARFGIDGVDALWDHLFEQAIPLPQLQQRLDLYFDELRGDEPGEHSDIAREAHMLAWIRHALAEGGRVLVVCGGWHQRALREGALRPSEVAAVAPVLPVPEQISRQGSFLIPYSDRRLEALAGYSAGMQSPAYYRRLFHDGAEAAAAWAQRRVVGQLRKAKQPVSTASLIAASTRSALLARLRGHPVPLRVDLLDGLLDALSSAALSAPPPWTQRGLLTQQHDPLLREALAALTGEAVGRLAPGTPLPPLVFDVEALLEAQQLDGQRSLLLDRRDDTDEQRAQTLWRLQLLGIPGVEHRGNEAAQAARQLSPDHYPQDSWQLTPSEAQQTALIEAGAWGPSLQAAALRRLEEQLAGCTEVASLAGLYATAVRAGFVAFGGGLLADLHGALQRCGDHGELGRAGLRLAALQSARLGGADHDALLRPVLNLLLARLLWLLEGLVGPHQPAQPADVAALALVERLLDHHGGHGVDTTGAGAVLARLAANGEAPPSLRGACFAVLWRHPQGDDAEAALLAAARGFARGEQLGDFLYGLFALARAECAGSSRLLGVLDAAIAAMDTQAFLVAAPALRQAFHYFPPRERALIASRVGALHGRADVGTPDWLRLSSSLADRQRAARLQQRVAELRVEYGL